jgi:hypothetical protein
MSKKINDLWFTLLEVVVATAILTISVFWVYKLIWENTKLITNFDSYKQWDTLFVSIEQCINHIWFDAFKNGTSTGYYFDFWSDLYWCSTWTISDKITLDNIEYKLSWEITWSWSDYIDWTLWVYSENNGTINKDFVQFK